LPWPSLDTQQTPHNTIPYRLEKVSARQKFQPAGDAVEGAMQNPANHCVAEQNKRAKMDDTSKFLEHFSGFGANPNA
jgi:hypothetical protein